MRFLIIAGLCLLLVGCGPNIMNVQPLYSGSTGVTLSFPPQNNLQEFGGDSFTVAVRLENTGATDINLTNPGYIRPQFDPGILTFQLATGQPGLETNLPNWRSSNQGMSVPFYLSGRSRDLYVGEVEYAEFTFQAKNLTGNRDQAPAPITFQACYPFTTTFLKDICVDRDIYNTQATKVCLGGTFTDSSQGAPVAVTSIEQRFVKTQAGLLPQYRIHLRNLAGGYILYSSTDQGSSTMCNLNGFDAAKFDRAYVTAAMTNDTLSCTGNGIATFENGEADIVCSGSNPLVPGANYLSPLLIQLHYFYISSITAKVVVTR